MVNKPRRAVRYLVDVPVELRTTDRILRGSGRDLTEAGIRVRVEGPVRMNERIGLSLRIPGFANIDLNFSGEVRWVKSLYPPPICEAGVEFDHNPDSRKRIQVLMWELQTGNLKEIERRTKTRRRETPR